MKFTKLLSLLLIICTIIGCMVACAPAGPVDYATQVTFDPTSTDTVKVKAEVKNHVDGDTTHFFVPTTVTDTGVLKARYLGINTPESTGQIQPWGKKASNFTKEKLESAAEIYIESDNDKWNLDSTGARHLVWVWYRPEGSDTFRNLNVEIMQEGLAIMSSAGESRYGELILSAFNQAANATLNVHSEERDPDFHYGEAIELTLKELRTNVANYVGMRVAFNAVVSKNSGADGVYVEAYDEETDMYNGMYIYYGKTAPAPLKDILKLGTSLRIVGKVSEYNGTYQVSDLTASMFRPGPNDTKKLDNEYHEAAYAEISPSTFKNGVVEVIMEDDEGNAEKKEYAYAELATGSTVCFNNLYVKRTSTTTNIQSSSYGAFTLYCEAADGTEISIRTAVLKDENGEIVQASDYLYQTISVNGVIEYYNPSANDDDYDPEMDTGFHYQVKVLSVGDLTIG